MKSFNPDKLIDHLIDKVVPIKGSYLKFCTVYEIDYSWLSKFINRKITNPTVRSLEKLDRSIDDWNQ